MKATSAPQPGKWERRQANYPEDHHDTPCAPELAVTDNPVVATLIGPTGAPIRQWRERPPFGFQKPEKRSKR